MSKGVYVLGGKCPGGKCPGGKCPGGICPWGKCPGGTCPGGLCPRTLQGISTFKHGYIGYDTITQFYMCRRTKHINLPFLSINGKVTWVFLGSGLLSSYTSL